MRANQHHMNKFLQYINETLVSLDIPALISVEEKPTYKNSKRVSNKSNTSQKK